MSERRVRSEDSWVIALGVGALLLLLAAIVVGLLMRAGGTANAPPSTPFAPTPNAKVADRMSFGVFTAHAQALVSDMAPAMNSVAAAQRSGDLAALRVAAVELQRLASQDLDWQRANADRILGGCYDDVAAAYSDAVDAENTAALYIIDFVDGRGPSNASTVIAKELSYSSDEFRRYASLASASTCV
jgi:hypothetical protein